jgi:hypothetical protein
MARRLPPLLPAPSPLHDQETREILKERETFWDSYFKKVKKSFFRRTRAKVSINFSGKRVIKTGTPKKVDIS